MAAERSRRRLRLTTAVLAATSVLLGSLVAETVRAEPAAALQMSSWDPGLIISDVVFYDAGSMGADQIQAFLAEKGTRCVPASDGTPCLKDYRQTTADRAADARCPRAYRGAANEPASQIIAKVAQACGINPRVLIVTLQKEQSLVTRVNAGTEAVYRKAMGYGCPDTSACDTRYYGFFNQVYSAASQLRNYALNPSKFRYKAGQVNSIAYHPDVARCGASDVLVRNQATASLYNYTPYQPNAAAIAAGLAGGDSCSSYGNRNFWVYFSTWFGSTLTSAPIGFLDSAVALDAQTVRVSGWVIEPDTTGPVTVHVYVDGQATAGVADQSRPDIAVAYPGWGDKHGFTLDVPATEGRHRVCVYGINQPTGENPVLGCREVVVVNQPPRGFVDSVSATASTVTASGWAWDPDLAGPTQLQVSIDGRVAGTGQADRTRADVAAAFPAAGGSRGFAVTVPAAAGKHQVCVTAVNAPAGANTVIGCASATVVNATPVGFLDQVVADPTGVRVSGWAWDPDASTPIGVQVLVDGRLVGSSTTGQSRPDVAAGIKGAPTTTGFDTHVAVAAGTHQVCVAAVNTPAGVNPVLRCATATVVNATPIGFVDTIAGDAAGVAVGGWTWDSDAGGPIGVHVYVDGKYAGATTSGLSRPDVAAAVKGASTTTGFAIHVAAAPGAHQVCVYAINAPAGINPQLACRSTTTG